MALVIGVEIFHQYDYNAAYMLKSLKEFSIAWEFNYIKGRHLIHIFVK